MPRVCVICAHPESDAINKSIADRVSYRDIACQFGMSHAAVGRHVKDCIPALLVAARSSQAARGGLAIDGALDEGFSFVRRLMRACDRWLADPEEDGEYTVEPRANEVSVIFADWTDCTPIGTPKKKREQLHVLLERVERTGEFVPESVTIKQADNRQLLLNALGEFRGWLDHHAKLNGLYQKDRENDKDKAAREARFERLIATFQKRYSVDRAGAIRMVGEHEPELVSKFVN